jgi:hypothetical protein
MPPSEPESEDAKNLFTAASQFKQAGVRTLVFALYAPTSVGARHWTRPSAARKSVLAVGRVRQREKACVALLKEKLDRKSVLAEGRTQ